MKIFFFFRDIDELDSIVEEMVEPDLPLPVQEGLNFFSGYLATKSGPESKHLGIKDNDIKEQEEFVSSKWLDFWLYVNSIFVEAK